MYTSSTQLPTIHFRLGAQSPEALDAYAAAFRAVRANLPLAQAEAATVSLERDAIAAFLGSSRDRVGGRWVEVGR